ncbi:hypothetical protein O181_059457 [Austropuccinia psidii MF-1]|uniref:Uncharacterized protein n=1 Tax=Austropuccinia psidii MF-1 TaxID=1389203 RepID=A0A9Q3EGQ2_9BASI|nr:hypothetical protein [Austropuccinia psidii MF-1]
MRQIERNRDQDSRKTQFCNRSWVPAIQRDRERILCRKICIEGNARNIPLLTSTFHVLKRCWFFPRYLRGHEIETREAVRTVSLVSLKARVGYEKGRKQQPRCVAQDVRPLCHETSEKLLNRSTRDKIENTLLPTKQITRPMDIIVSDFMGPFEKANINAGRWVITIPDVALTYGECQIITSKADAAAVLQGTIMWWEIKTQHWLKTLCTNGGGEFWSKGMNHWCTVRHYA